MKRMLLVPGCALFMISDPAITSAACYWDRGNYFVDRDATYTERIRITEGTEWCARNFSSGGTNTFHSIRVTVQPKNGRLAAHGEYSTTAFRYYPRKGFKGSDFFVMTVCGENRSGHKGCARLEFPVTVE